MTVQTDTFPITRGSLQARAGHALEISLWGASYVHDPTAETIADITATEASGGTYARTALTGLSYDVASESLLADDVTVIGVVYTIGAYVISDPDDGDKLIADGTFPSLVVSGDLPITPTDGAWAQYSDSAADIDALAAILDTAGATTGQVLTVATPGDPAEWAESGGSPGAWLSITPPADWANLGDPAIQDDPTLPTLQVRHSAAADQVDIRWEGFAAAADVASALVDGAITFTALIPAGYRPASILGHPYAALRIGHSYPDGPIIPAQIAINAAGDMFVRVGTTLPDGVTSLTTYLGGADGVILTIGGNYPLT